MADISFTGKIYNSAGGLIDGTVEGFAYPQNKWSGVKTSQLNEYTINVGDGDWLTNDGTITVGEVVVLRFRSADGIAAISHTITNEDISTRLVVQDIQLLPIQDPTCTLNLSLTGTINNKVTASATSSDQYQWNYAGKAHHQRHSWYGTTIFPEIGIDKVEYDFGLGYGLNDSHTWTSIGVYTVKSKSTNKNGQSAVCTKEIKIGYNAPTGCIQFDKTGYILNDNVIVSGCIADEDNRIVSVAHQWDGVTENTNTNKNYAYTKSLSTVKTYTAKQVIAWNDGFENKIVEFSRNLSMQNQPPIVDIKVTDDDNMYTFNSNAVDPENMLDRVEWIVYACKQELMLLTGECDWVEVYRTNGLEINLTVRASGSYKVVATAYDNFGATGTDEVIHIMNGVEGGCDIPVKEIIMKMSGTCTSIKVENKPELIQLSNQKEKVHVKDMSNKVEILDNLSIIHVEDDKERIKL